MLRTLRTPKSIALMLSAAAAMVMISAAPALAADTGDTLNIPLGTSFTISNSTNITFSGSINGLPVTVTCTGVTLTVKYETAGLTVVVTSSPPVSFTGCTDSLGGRDTVTSSGSWSLTLVDNPNETGTEPNSDKLTINIPQGGASFTSSVLSSCTVTANASTPTGNYDDKTTATYSNTIGGNSISVTGTGCSATSTKLGGSFKSSITVGDTN